MKTSQTPLNTPQPDTKDVQDALDRQKAYTRKLHGEVQEIQHHRSCLPLDQDLVWHCSQCGLNEPFYQRTKTTPETKLIVASIAHADKLAEQLKQCLHTLPLNSKNPVIRQIITESWQTITAYEAAQ